jgi:hypothetical protein
MKKALFCCLLIAVFCGCKGYYETLSLNQDMKSGDMDVKVSYDVAQAEKNKIETYTEKQLRAKFAAFKGIDLQLCTIKHNDTTNWDDVTLWYSFDSCAAFNKLSDGKWGVPEAGHFELEYNADKNRYEYVRTALLDDNALAVYKLVIPDGFKVTSTDATSKEGNTLSWRFDSEDGHQELEFYAFIEKKK